LTIAGDYDCRCFDPDVFLHAYSGFVDIFSKSKDRLKSHASKILKFLHRNRIPSSAIPFPVLEGYNSICTMRSSVLQDFLEYLLQKEKGKWGVGSLHQFLSIQFNSESFIGMTKNTFCIAKASKQHRK